jgi:RNA polymerase sigma factor for flagellar operon FliA
MPHTEKTTKQPPQDSAEVLARLAEGFEVVDALARQMRRQFGPYVNEDDLVSQGREALLAAARSFDAERGLTFRSWANLRVRGAMIDSVRSAGVLPRRVYRKLRAAQAADLVHEATESERSGARPDTPEQADTALRDQLGTAAMAMALSLLTMRSGDAIEKASDPTKDPEEQTAEAELVAKVRQAIDELPNAERHLLQRHYFDDVNFDEAARELGLSKSWASRLHARAIEGLGRSLRNRGVAG